LYLLLSEDLPNKCRKFRASERVLDELELELLIAPESTGAPVAATVPPPVPPPVPPSPSEEVEGEEDEELSSLFAQPRKTKLIIARKIRKFVEFFILSPWKKFSVLEILKRRLAIIRSGNRK
jgi:hypothetical protein